MWGHSQHGRLRHRLVVAAAIIALLIVHALPALAQNAAAPSSPTSPALGSPADLTPLGSAAKVRHPQPVYAGSIRDVAAGNGRYVAVGPQGSVLLSLDGATWSSYAIDSSLQFNRILFGGTQFMAVSNTDNPFVANLYRSSDGKTWTPTGPSKQSISALFYMHDRWFVTAPGHLYTSTDGQAWTTSGDFNPTFLAYGDGAYVGLDMKKSYISIDGLHWQTNPAPNDGLMFWQGLAYGNGRFVALGDANQCYTTTDGTSWSKQHLPGWAAKGVTFSNGQFVIGDAMMTPGALVSSDGLNWTYRPVQAPGLTFAVTKYLENQFVGFAEGVVYRSPDGQTWSPWLGWPKGRLLSLAYGNGRWVAVGQMGSLLTSPDGVNWTPRESGTQDDLSAVTYGGGRFVAISTGNNRTCTRVQECIMHVLTSLDGLTWTTTAVPGELTLNGVVYGNNRYVAVAPFSSMVSVDGVNWDQSANLPAVLTSVAFGAGRYVAVGTLEDGGGHVESYVYTSADGLHWEIQTLDGLKSWLRHVIFAGGQFVAVGDNDAEFTSPDGMHWTRHSVGWYALHSVAYGPSGYVAVGRPGWGTISMQGIVLVSPDAVHWHAYTTPYDLFFAQYQGGRLLAVGQGGLILDQPDPQQPEAHCGARFVDVPSLHPGCTAIESLAQRGIISGYPDGTFQPERQITRAEFARLLTAMKGWTVHPGDELPFSDVSDHWVFRAGYLQAAVAAGVFGGFPDGTFRPGAPLTRAQLIRLAVTVAKVGPGTTKLYADVAADAWYAGAVAAASSARLIGPEAVAPVWADDFLHGELPATRAEAAALLFNIQAVSAGAP